MMVKVTLVLWQPEMIDSPEAAAHTFSLGNGVCGFFAAEEVASPRDDPHWDKRHDDYLDEDAEPDQVEARRDEETENED